MALISVIAKTLGQKPDGDWVRPGDEFEIEKSLVSTRWMTRADGKPWAIEKPVAVSDGNAVDALKALLAGERERANAAEKAVVEANDRINAVKVERSAKTAGAPDTDAK